jgi:hypothetical protein
MYNYTQRKTVLEIFLQKFEEICLKNLNLISKSPTEIKSFEGLHLTFPAFKTMVFPPQNRITGY